LASFLPLRIKRGDIEIKLFEVSICKIIVFPDDPATRLRGNHAGLRVGADLWWEPTPNVMSIV
jgi:hypothetical protein